VYPAPDSPGSSRCPSYPFSHRSSDPADGRLLYPSAGRLEPSQEYFWKIRQKLSYFLLTLCAGAAYHGRYGSEGDTRGNFLRDSRPSFLPVGANAAM